MMKVLVLFLAGLALAHGRPRRGYETAVRKSSSPYLTWSDCGIHPMRPLKIHHLTVAEDPIRLPGTLTLSYDVENTGTIQNMDVKVKMERRVAFVWVSVPCISGLVGSCTHTDICGTYLPDGSCPIGPGRFVEDFVFNLPSIPGTSLFSGRYRMNLKFTETGTERELGCFDVDVEVDFN